MSNTHDVVIIGGGHNGLVTAFYLARAGYKPLVLERRNQVGGAAITEKFILDFAHLCWRTLPGLYVRKFCATCNLRSMG